MEGKQFNLLYGLRKGTLVHISEVESGLKCECKCPSCDAKLVARKGKKNKHHFAHHATDNCKYGYETSLHFAVKEIILTLKLCGSRPYICVSTQIKKTN